MTRAKQIRVLLLLMLLTPLVYAFRLPSNPAPNWDQTKIIGIYPYNSDGSDAAANYIETLQTADFQIIEDYLQDQARTYALPLQKPFDVRLGNPIATAPSMPEAGSTSFERLAWALKLRWWHWKLDTQELQPDIIVVARFQAGNNRLQYLHSIGMPNPRVAFVSLLANAEFKDQNKVTIAHEVLHTIGADDLYQAGSGLPEYPAGYAFPQLQPRYPQPEAELMAGRIPLSSTLAREAKNLSETSIGPVTAQQIGWPTPISP